MFVGGRVGVARLAVDATDILLLELLGRAVRWQHPLIIL